MSDNNQDHTNAMHTDQYVNIMNMFMIHYKQTYETTKNQHMLHGINGDDPTDTNRACEEFYEAIVLYRDMMTEQPDSIDIYPPNKLNDLRERYRGMYDDIYMIYDNHKMVAITLSLISALYYVQHNSATNWHITLLDN